MRFLALLILSALAGCATSTPRSVPLATARVAADFESYPLRRVGLLPFCGEKVAEEQSSALQGAFLTEIHRRTDFEVVPLNPADLEEIPASEPFRVGWIQPRTVIDLARRYSLDAVLIGTVTDRQYFVPQRLGIQLDMVAAETGVSIWSAAVHLDASHDDVRRGIEAWFNQHKADVASGETWELALLSPRRFAQFAAYQIAQQL
jgi:hypothetical protein